MQPGPPDGGAPRAGGDAAWPRDALAAREFAGRGPTVDAGAAGPLDRALAALVADGRVADAVAGRSQRHWLGQAAVEDASIGGVLLAAGEAVLDVVLGVGAVATPLRGRVTAVGDDFVVLAGPGLAAGAVVARDAVLWVRAEPGSRLPVGDVAPATGLAWAALWAELAAERAEVALTLRDGSTALRGTAVGAGTDAVRLRLDGADRGEVAVAMRAVALSLVGV